jgi:diguanylate cyclase (GGDEF)-like protein
MSAGMDGRIGTVRGILNQSRRGYRRASQMLPELLAILACVLVIWVAVGLALWQARSTAMESARHQTEALARAFAESTERISTVVDRELLAVRASITEQGDHFDLNTWIRTRSSPDHLAPQMGYTDRAGWVVQLSRPMHGHRVNIADRAHFRAQLDPGRDALFISKPVTGRYSQRCSVQYSRKILDRAGVFNGVVVESVDCADLSRFYGTVDFGDGFVILVGQDGIIRGYGPIRPGVIGTNLAASPAFARALTEPEGSFTAIAPWDGVRRVIGFRRVAAYPLTVMVGYDNGRIFRQYQPIFNRALEIGAAATIVILVLGGVWIEQRNNSVASRRALRVTLDNMAQGIVMVDPRGRIPVINKRAVTLLDLPAALLEPRRPLVRGEAQALGLVWADEAAEGQDSGPDTLHRNGRIIETYSHRIPDGAIVRTFTDVTERRIADARIRHMAHHDALTGLANRALLTERITELFQSGRARPFGVIWINLDGFKTVNDTLGHDAGDRLLRETGRRLNAVAGGDALVARTGGDEFALLCDHDSQPATTTELATSVVTMLRDPVDIDGTQFRLSASLGLGFFPDDGTSATDLLRHAAAAMHHAKNRGRGLIVRFDPEMDRAMWERGRIERDLREAVRERGLELWFQPRFDRNAARISGFEALARWRHPERGFIPPSEFIPIAEQCGLIADLGLLVLEDACVFAAGLPDCRIAVNLSPVQFLSTNLAEVISDVMARSHLRPERLELEVTEGVLIADEAQALATLRTLHERGLHLALDDFGTGYASLSYLRRFPFDRIKVDQSFVRAQEHDATTQAIVESILTMARRLRLEVTAEGVETEHQLRLLLNQGCPEVQGYYLGKPMPAEEAVAFYLNHDAARTGQRVRAA